MGHVAIPFNWKEFISHRGSAFKFEVDLRCRPHASGGKQGNTTRLYSSLHWIPGEMLKKSVEVTCHSREKYTAGLSAHMLKTLSIGSTEQLETAVEQCCKRRGLVSSRSQDSKECHMMQHTMTRIQTLVDKLQTGNHTKSIIDDLGKKGTSKTFSEAARRTIKELGNIELYDPVDRGAHQFCEIRHHNNHNNHHHNHSNNNITTPTTTNNQPPTTNQQTTNILIRAMVVHFDF